MAATEKKEAKKTGKNVANLLWIRCLVAVILSSAIMKW